MKILTGVVLEKHDDQIVVLTDSGEFRQVKITGRLPEIGDEVRIPVRTRRKWSMPRFGWIAAAAAVFLFMLVSPLALQQFNQPPETAVAWVSIDINPAVELTVSNREKVMAAQAYNRDGEKILSLVDVKGMKVKKAVNEITQKALELGYMGKSKDNTVLISVAVKPTAGIDKNALQNVLLASAREILQGEALGGTVQLVSVTPELREKAVGKKITAGKYAVLIEAVAGYKLNVTEEDMKEKSVAKAITDAGGKVDEVLAKAQDEKEFDKNEKEYLKIASERAAIAAADVSGRESGNAADNVKDPETGTTKPSGGHRYVDTIRGGKDPESVADNTYKNDQNNTVDNGAAGNQTGDSQEPPADNQQPPDANDRGGLEQNTGNYVVTEQPVDDLGMSRRKPNF